jgi:hypothetical protein
MKKTARNDITGAWIVSKPNTEMFEKNFDLIFGKQVETKILEQKEIQEGISDIEYELNKSTGEVQKVDNGNS